MVVRDDAGDSVHLPLGHFDGAWGNVRLPRQEVSCVVCSLFAILVEGYSWGKIQIKRTSESTVPSCIAITCGLISDCLLFIVLAV